jgi:hypothetical protein
MYSQRLIFSMPYECAQKDHVTLFGPFISYEENDENTDSDHPWNVALYLSYVRKKFVDVIANAKSD